MNTIRPHQYQQANGNFKSANSETDKDGHNQQNPNEQQGRDRRTVARGRAEDAQTQTSPVQNRVPLYSPAANAYPQAFPQQRQTYAVNTPPTIRHNAPNPIQYQNYSGSYQSSVQPLEQPAQTRTASHRSNKINIAQILKDFRNTIKAIATPEDIEEQVNRYLETVVQQVKSEHPQINLVQSNLKIAASLLDKYISETLNKESKVVQNWLDALFLQRIDYSYNEDDINPNFLVKFPEQENKTQETQTEPENLAQDDAVNTAKEEYFQAAEENDFQAEEETEDEPQKLSLDEEYSQARQSISQKPNITIVPQDTRLKSLFVEAKKQAFNNNPKKAMMIFKEAFNRAGEINDNETQSRICLEIGKIYDDNDHFVQALSSYNKSLQYTTDVNVKSHAHFSMAQIYDDVNQIEPALNHYMTSISYAGKSDDLIGQSDSLTRMANIFTDKYNEEAFEYYDTARKLVEQTTDSCMKGYVLSNTADACVQFRKNDKALKYYAEAVKNYEKTNSSEEIAQNYKSAAELMISFNSPNKAKSLLKKALVNAVKTTNEDLVAEINMLLSSVEV